MDDAPGAGGAPGDSARPEPTEPDVRAAGSIVAGRYRILRLLGKGAMGAVYLAEHLKFGRKDAIKVLQASVARDPESVARFTRGARNASAIRHPNVCTVYDFGETEDGFAFLAMEYVDGESLSDVLSRQGALDLQSAGDILCQVAAALAAAHAVGIVHRDLKPANVMLARPPGGPPVAKVVDFDIAKGEVDGEEAEVTRLGFVVGTPEFMSPEQLTGDPLDGRCDVYSLGVLLFRTVTGSLPHLAESTQELMVKRLTETPLRLDEAAPGRPFPRSLQSLLDRALERKPADRLASAAEFQRMLRAVLDEVAAGVPQPADDTLAAVPPTRVARPEPSEPPPVRPRRWLLGVGGALLAALILGVGYGALTSGARTLEIDPAEAVLMEAGSITMAAVTEDGAALPPGGPLQWASDDPRVARVDPTGLVTAGAVGSATITATSGRRRGESRLTVIAATRLGVDPARLDFRVQQGDSAPPPLVARVTTDGPVTGADVEVRDPSGRPAPWVRTELAEDRDGLSLTVTPDARGMPGGSHEAILTVTARPEGHDLTVAADLALSLLVEEGSDPSPPRPPEPTPEIASPEEIEPLLTRQEQALNDIALGDRPRSAAGAVEDTARAVLDLGWLTQDQRAEAAFVLAGALLELRNCPQAVRWAREAVRLAPDERGYRTFLDQAERCGS